MKQEIQIYKAIQYLIEALGFSSVEELEANNPNHLIEKYHQNLDKKKIDVLEPKKADNKSKK